MKLHFFRDDQGCTFVGENCTVKIEKQGKTVLIGKKVDGLYIMKKVNQPKYVLLSETVKNSELELWHRRLSHISERGLNELMKQHLIQTRGTKRLL